MTLYGLKLILHLRIKDTIKIISINRKAKTQLQQSIVLRFSCSFLKKEKGNF